MFTISKAYTFSASHKLDHLPAEHPCSRLHGHNYEMTIELSSPVLDSHRMVGDYHELDALIKPWLAQKVDHRDLNRVCYDMDTTAENVARWFHTELSRLLGDIIDPADVGVRITGVCIKETSKTAAWFRP